VPKLLSVGGFAAAAVLIVLGLAVTVIGVVGRGYVQDQLAQEKIVGSDDMTPDATRAAVEEATGGKRLPDEQWGARDLSDRDRAHHRQGFLKRVARRPAEPQRRGTLGRCRTSHTPGARNRA
jgi:hypothetical protein